MSRDRVYTYNIYIYIYRERERGREAGIDVAVSNWLRLAVLHVLGHKHDELLCIGMLRHWVLAFNLYIYIYTDTCLTATNYDYWVRVDVSKQRTKQASEHTKQTSDQASKPANKKATTTETINRSKMIFYWHFKYRSYNNSLLHRIGAY